MRHTYAHKSLMVSFMVGLHGMAHSWCWPGHPVIGLNAMQISIADLSQQLFLVLNPDMHISGSNYKVSNPIWPRGACSCRPIKKLAVPRASFICETDEPSAFRGPNGRHRVVLEACKWDKGAKCYSSHIRYGIWLNGFYKGGAPPYLLVL